MAIRMMLSGIAEVFIAVLWSIFLLLGTSETSAFYYSGVTNGFAIGNSIYLVLAVVAAVMCFLLSREKYDTRRMAASLVGVVTAATILAFIMTVVYCVHLSDFGRLEVATAALKFGVLGTTTPEVTAAAVYLTFYLLTMPVQAVVLCFSVFIYNKATKPVSPSAGEMV